jgi:hypothetical protein
LFITDVPQKATEAAGGAGAGRARATDNAPGVAIRRARTTKKQRLLDFAAARGWARIGESEWNELRRALPDVSVSVIRQAGLPIDPPWSGVGQHTFEELENSLCEFSAVYESRPDLRQFCRKEVIAAKDRAKWLSFRETVEAETRKRKAVMAERMLVWLGDPAIFPAWIQALHARSHETL